MRTDFRSLVRSFEAPTKLSSRGTPAFGRVWFGRQSGASGSAIRLGIAVTDGARTLSVTHLDLDQESARTE